VDMATDYYLWIYCTEHATYLSLILACTASTLLYYSFIHSFIHSFTSPLCAVLCLPSSDSTVCPGAAATVTG
jgi:hypothetical protein